ncbi:hypothetical protein TWF730_006437 [Orbilia blumenaviensis]|uniref:Uncharacterized protein n=1 Tax=Orbilia blumenaviensis TaxID=1796055 RepID=A0AAV9VGK7_9PEZI
MRVLKFIQALLALVAPAIIATRPRPQQIDEAKLPIRRRVSCPGNNCYTALINDPLVAASTCAQIVSRRVATVTVTDFEFVSTETKTQTVYDATTTSTVLQGENFEKQVAKRGDGEIRAECNGSPIVFYNACICFLEFGGNFNAMIPTPTTKTVRVTLSDAIRVVYDQITTTGILTVTEPCQPRASYPLPDGWFLDGQLGPDWQVPPVGLESEAGSYRIDEDISLPEDPSASTWRHPVFNASVFRTGLSNARNSKFILAQNMDTCGNIAYNLSFSYRFEGTAGRGSYIKMFVDGVELADINNGPTTWTRVGLFPFVATGYVSVLRIELINELFERENLYLDYFYITDPYSQD